MKPDGGRWTDGGRTIASLGRGTIASIGGGTIASLGGKTTDFRPSSLVPRPKQRLFTGRYMDKIQQQQNVNTIAGDLDYTTNPARHRSDVKRYTICALILSLSALAAYTLS